MNGNWRVVIKSFYVLNLIHGEWTGSADIQRGRAGIDYVKVDFVEFNLALACRNLYLFYLDKLRFVGCDDESAGIFPAEEDAL